MAGYIGTTPVPQATQHRESFTATGGQTSFATAGYTPQFIDVYLNGVKLAPADYTATNGSDVVLASGATASDILEIVAYTPFEVANQTFTGTTTAANLTVTGAFTSQGIDDNADAVAITIDSSENVGIGTSSPTHKVHISTTDSTPLSVEHSNGSDVYIKLVNNADGAGNFLGASSNNLTFWTENAERMRITSAGNVGIGTSSPLRQLSLQNSSHAEISLVSGTSSVCSILMGDGTTGTDYYRGYIQYENSNDAMAFATGTTERMRIGSDGTLLVGRTAEGDSNVGHTFRQDGFSQTTRSGGLVADFNRLSSDGDICRFQKDGSTVGSIGTVSSRLHIENGDTGLRIAGDLDQIFPCGSGGGDRDAAIDLGSTGVRFKDLYLSGGVYLGGTGSANKISDYEEGTWTPTVSEGNVTAESAWYVKVGKLVTVSAKLDAPSNNSNTGSLFVEGLPFTTKASNHTSMGSMMGDNISGGPYFPYVSNNSTDMRFYAQTSGGFSALRYVDTNSSTSIYFTITYHTQ